MCHLFRSLKKKNAKKVFFVDRQKQHKHKNKATLQPIQQLVCLKVCLKVRLSLLAASTHLWATLPSRMAAALDDHQPGPLPRVIPSLRVEWVFLARRTPQDHEKHAKHAKHAC